LEYLKVIQVDQISYQLCHVLDLSFALKVIYGTDFRSKNRTLRAKQILGAKPVIGLIL